MLLQGHGFMKGDKNTMLNLVEQHLKFQYSKADVPHQVSIRYSFLLSEVDVALFESGS